MSTKLERPPLALLPVAALVAAVVWLVLLGVAPMLAPEASVQGLHGEENNLDHGTLWLSMDLVPGLVYALGDVMCHQIAERSLTLNGNQVPVAGRMTAIFAAAVVGLAMGARPGLRRDRWFFSDATLDALALPEGRWPRTRAVRVVLAIGVIVIGLLPAAVDVAWQAVSVYESTMAQRLVTGALAGLVGGVALACGLRVVETVAWRGLTELGWRDRPEDA